MSTINERLREIRKLFKFSQQQFANELGISRTHISNMENGNDNPSSALIKLICVKFNINEQWLSEGNGGQFPDYDNQSDEGLLAKYNTMKVSLEQMLRERNGDDLRNTVESFSFFVGLLAANKLQGKEKTQYLDLVANTIDEYERLQYRVSTLDNLYSKNTDERHWLELLETCNAHFCNGNQYFKEAVNLYLQKYGEDRKL